MLGNGATSVIAGIIVGVTLEIFGVPFALLLGVFVALVDLLPLVGGLLAGVPVVIIAAIHSVPAGITMLIVFLVYQQVENHVLNPVIMSRTVQLNPFWVLIAVLVGATLGGRVAGGLGTFVGALVGHPDRRGHPGDRAGAAPRARRGRGHRSAGAAAAAGDGAGRHLRAPVVRQREPVCRRRGEEAGQGQNRVRPPLRPAKESVAATSPRMPVMRPLVVIPTYNESENIERMLHRIHECLPGAGVLVVDDGSPDGTADLVKGVAAELPDVHLLARAAKSGLGSAYRAGFAWGLERGYDACIEIDADFSHDPAALPSLVAPLEEGFDVSIGSRYVEGGSIPNWAWHRHLLSRGGNVYASAVLGLGVADSTAGYRAYSAGILRRLDLDRIRAEGYGFQIEMTYRAKQHGAAITEVPISFVDRAAGESKMSSFIVVEALGLVTWWGLGRIVRGARRVVTGGRRGKRRRRSASRGERRRGPDDLTHGHRGPGPVGMSGVSGMSAGRPA